MVNRKFWGLARGSVLVLAIVIPLAAAVEIAVSTLLQLITDTATGKSHWSYGWLVALVAGYIVVDALRAFVRAYLEQVTLNRIVTGVRERLLAALFRQPTGVAHDEQGTTTGYYNEMTATLAIFRSDYLQGSVNAYAQLWQFGIALGVSVMIKPVLSLLIVLLCLPGLGLPFLQRHRLKDNKQRVLTQTQAVTRQLQDATQGLRTIQLFNVQARLQALFRQQSRRLLRAQDQDQRTRKAVGGVSQFLDNLLYLGTWIGGVYFVMNRTITLGQLVAFSQLMIFISEPIQSAAGLLSDVVGGRTAAALLRQRLAAAPEKPALAQLGTVRQVAYQNVTLTVADRAVLRQVTLTLRVGQRSLIVGPSGSGKSTLLTLPLSGETPITGTLRVNGRSVTDYASSDLAAHIGVLTQDSLIFDTTIANNLALFDPAISPERLMAVLRRVGLTAYATPAGLQQRVSRQGHVLSGGERHRLALARVLLHPGEWTILDEPLTGLDPQTAREMGRVIADDFPGGWAVVTHQYDPALFAAADQIVVLAHGRVVATGSVTAPAIQDWLHRLKLIEEPAG